MSHATEGAVIQRLERLEQENRRLAREARLIKRLGGVTLFGVLIALSVGASLAQLPTIEAGRIIIKDFRTGRVRYDIGINGNDGRGNFLIMDQNGNRRIDITTSDDGFTGIQFIAPNGQVVRTVP